MKTVPGNLVLVLALAGLFQQVASASSVMDWTDEALNAIAANKTSAPEASRNLAMMNAAIYDAVNGVVGGHVAYQVQTSAPTGASAEAAAAAAAYTVMSQLYKSVDFSATYQSQLAAIPDGAAKTAGMNWGINVAGTILTARAADGSASAATKPYTISSTPGHWQKTPHSDPVINATAKPLLPGWGDVTPLGVSSVVTIQPGAPPALTSSQYAADYNEVLNKGALVGSIRTDDQTHSAVFWNAAQGNVTRVGVWNEIASSLASKAGLDLATESRMMAALNVALADAEIVAWKAKYEYDRWRPLSAIANGGSDGNAGTIGDPFAGGFGGWDPLLDTPRSPGFVSGDSAADAAARQVLLYYLGDVAITKGMDVNGDGVIDDADALYDRNNDGVIDVLDE